MTLRRPRRLGAGLAEDEDALPPVQPVELHELSPVSLAAAGVAAKETTLPTIDAQLELQQQQAQRSATLDNHSPTYLSADEDEYLSHPSHPPSQTQRYHDIGEALTEQTPPSLPSSSSDDQLALAKLLSANGSFFNGAVGGLPHTESTAKPTATDSQTRKRPGSTRSQVAEEDPSEPVDIGPKPQTEHEEQDPTTRENDRDVVTHEADHDPVAREGDHHPAMGEKK